MTRKELKNVAKQIAKYERIIQSSEDKNERYDAENAIIKLSDKIEDLSDMVILDDLIKEYLEKT